MSELNNKAIRNESDRAVAVLGPAYLDTLLEDVLRAYFRETKEVESLLSSSGSLGAFSVRVDLVNALGLLDDNEAGQLHLIRKIRNQFAHNIDTYSFEDPKIKDRCRELKAVTAWGQDASIFAHAGAARSIFILALTLSVRAISNAMRYAQRRVLVPPINQFDESWTGF